MAEDKKINVAVILSAYDKVSAVVNQVVSATTAKLQALQKFSDKASAASYAYGRNNLKTGAIIAAPLLAAAKMYGDQEEAALRMRTAMMQDGGKVNEKSYQDLIKFSSQTSEQLTGSTADYLRMVKVLQENSIKPDEILGGIGGAVARLSVFFKMAPDQIAQFAARMKQDMGVMPKEMNGMMDFISRLNNAGVGKDGSEAVTEMGEAFSKAGLGAHNLGVSGLQASKDLGALMGIFIRRGLSGGTVGTNFRRIFDGLRDGEKLKKANDIAKQYGITLDFYNKDHKFKGIANFTGELGKLQGLNTQQVSAILKPFGGKQGLSTDFLEFLAKDGTSSFNDFQHKLSSQATLTAKVKVIMSGLSNEFERTKTTAINSAAAIGSTYAPQLKALVNNLNNLFSKLTKFVTTHKELVGSIVKALGYFAAYKLATGGIAMVAGGLFKEISNGIKVYNFFFKKIQGVTAFMKVAGPITRFFTTGFARLAVIMMETVVPAVQAATVAAWEFTAALLANPITWIVLGVVALAAGAYLIYKKWSPISKWFSDQWKMMKAQIAGVISVLKLFGNLMLSIGKIYLGVFTFSPSMVIAGIKESASAMHNIFSGGIGQAYNSGYNKSMAGNSAVPVATTTHYHFAPTVNLHGGTGDSAGHAVLKPIKSQFDTWMKEHEARKKRLSY